MFFGYFLKTFGTFKRRGGAIERLKKKTFNIRYPITTNKAERGGATDSRQKKMSTYPISTKKAECVCSLSRKFFSLSGTKESLNVGVCKSRFIFGLKYCRFYQNVIEMK